MKKIIEVLRLKYAAVLSHERIARACGLSKGTVNNYLSATHAQGITWPLPEDLDEARLEALLFPTRQPASRLVEPDYFQMHQSLKRKGVTLQLLWAEYVGVHGERGYRYSQYCNRYRLWRERQKRSMRQIHLAGEKLFIDYCGPTLPIVDRHTGEIRQAQVFVCVLGASSYTYAEATHSQSLPDWIASHQRALRFYGGVPALLVPDNLKSAVDLADRYEPGINATYAEMAAHYGTAVLPARPYKPKDKAKAEVGVQIVERWILARLRHHSFFSLAELNALEQQQAQPATHDLAFEERFALLVDREVLYRENRRLARLLKAARLRVNACVQDIDYRHPRGLRKANMAQLASLEWVRQSLNLCLTGPTGCGKTWIACALGNQACRAGLSVRYVRLPTLLEHLRIAHGDGS